MEKGEEESEKETNKKKQTLLCSVQLYHRRLGKSFLFCTNSGVLVIPVSAISDN